MEVSVRGSQLGVTGPQGNCNIKMLSLCFISADTVLSAYDSDRLGQSALLGQHSSRVLVVPLRVVPLAAQHVLCGLISGGQH